MRWRRSRRDDDADDAAPGDELGEQPGRALTLAIASFPDALLDAWLLEQFPGKTLEELDGIDFPRLWRALRAREVDRLEMQLPLYHEKKWQPTEREWRAILWHDELWARCAPDG